MLANVDLTEPGLLEQGNQRGCCPDTGVPVRGRERPAVAAPGEVDQADFVQPDDKSRDVPGQVQGVIA
jgi:hypothetical protein